ncbi:MAG: hypothetical protein DLM72_02740 [Candidatus Nitrosopolaris wilkensis]|nr:MAG: hypothetical protein DLM72_02740 [Candidatus Nitrosopolaris wilkensis]
MAKESSQTIPQEATKLKKLTKVSARYMEMDQFSDSDHHTGHFCYNCISFMKPNHCAIVTDEGNVNGRTSGVIAQYLPKEGSAGRMPSVSQLQKVELTRYH